MDSKDKAEPVEPNKSITIRLMVGHSWARNLNVHVLYKEGHVAEQSMPRVSTLDAVCLPRTRGQSVHLCADFYVTVKDHPPFYSAPAPLRPCKRSNK